MRRSTDCLDSKRWRSLTCLHLPVKGLRIKTKETSEGPRLGTLRIMATTLRVPVVLALVHGIKGGIHSVDGRHSVYRQTYKGWNEIESSSFKINTY